MSLGTWLNSDNPTTLRGLMFLALSETGSVQSPTVSDDAGGGGPTTWVSGTSIPCRIDPLGNDARTVVGGRLDERSTHLVTVPRGTSVSTKNRFDISGRGTYEVTATREQTSEDATFFEVIRVS